MSQVSEPQGGYLGRAPPWGIRTRISVQCLPQHGGGDRHLSRRFWLQGSRLEALPAAMLTLRSEQHRSKPTHLEVKPQGVVPTTLHTLQTNTSHPHPPTHTRCPV